MAATISAAFINPLVNAFITPIIKPLYRHLGYLFRSGANVRNLEKASDELKQREDELHEEIVRAGAQSDEIVPTKKAKEWMGKVQTMNDGVIAKIVEDYERPKARLTAFSCCLGYKIGKRAEKAVLEVEELTGKQFPVTESRPPVVRMMPTLPEVTPSSTGEYLEEAIDYIQRDDVGMVGIWGMGGVGKTTLLRKINNDQSIATAGFDFVILVVASQDLNLVSLRKAIAERIHADDAELYHYLEKKSFLLLLDDIWEPFDLTNGVGIPLPYRSEGVTPKRKIVFTTRSEEVCEQMEALLQVRCNKIKINCLVPEESWKLFLHNVGDRMRSIIDSDPRVRDRAKIVADKCGGLPQALEIIARAMSVNKTWREWENAINQINTSGIQGIDVRGIQGIDGAGLFPLLKVSYNCLPNDCIKKCFLCCALWPEDHEIQVEELIDCWWGMDLIDDRGDINKTYTKGYDIIERLKGACLLEQVEVDNYIGDRVKMHPIIHGMALSIVLSSEMKWMVKNRNNMKDGSEDAKHWHEAKIIWLSHNRSGVLPQDPDCPDLSFLMLSRNFGYIRVIPKDFFQNMSRLKFLDLSYTSMSVLPPAIGGLRQLQHLNISHTSVGSLPVELRNLAELKVLLVDRLHIMDGGLLSKFPKLGHLGVSEMEVGDFMEELAGSTITSLDCLLERIGTVNRLAELTKNPSISIRFLEIQRLEGVTTLPLSSLLRIGNTRSTLSRLNIGHCDELENITISNQCEEISNQCESLEYFRLQELLVLKEITSSAGSLLRYVRHVQIRQCRELRSATWILHCTLIESLEIIGCHEMEHVIGNNEGAVQSENSKEFSRFTSLGLEDLPKLRSTTTLEIRLPSLKNVLIKRCPVLVLAPFRRQFVQRNWE